jgi:transcriptional regulator with XRE-family HTH domain
LTVAYPGGYNRSMSADSFPFRLRILRERRKLSRADLAQRAGTTRMQIYRYEEGLRVPTLIVLDQLATALGVSTGCLLQPVPDKTGP